MHDAPAGPDGSGHAPLEPVPLPLDGRLDLHLFHPRDVPALLDGYLPACRAAGVLALEIIHGKGTGALGRRVRALLARRSDVVSARTADEARGGWGVTLVNLAPVEGPASDGSAGVGASSRSPGTPSPD